MSIQVVSTNFVNGAIEVIVECPNRPTVTCDGVAVANVVSLGNNRWKATVAGPFPPGRDKAIEVTLTGTDKVQRLMASEITQHSTDAIRGDTG
jgi:hypothetical protein